MTLTWYKREPRAFLRGTQGMDGHLKGCYSTLLDLIYDNDGNLRDDDRFISGVLGYSIKQWKKYKNDLLEMGKIVILDGFISNFRANLELENSAKFQDKQRKNRSNPNKNNNLQSPKCDHIDKEEDIDKNINKKGLERGSSFKNLNLKEIPKDWLEFAQSQGLSSFQAINQFQSFADWWISEGKVKKDWFATWRNRIRSWIADGKIKPQGNIQKPQTQDGLRQAVEMADKGFGWNFEKHGISLADARQLINPKKCEAA